MYLLTSHVEEEQDDDANFGSKTLRLFNGLLMPKIGLGTGTIPVSK